MKLLWGRELIDGKTLPYCTTLSGWQDALEIFSHYSSLRHIMSMCRTDLSKENKGMIKTLAGTKLGVSCLENMFTLRCHAEIGC